VNDLFNIDDRSLASAVDAYDNSLSATARDAAPVVIAETTAQVASAVSNAGPLAYNDYNYLYTPSNGVVYYNSDEDLKVTYDDVWTGVKETLKAMVTYQR